MKTEQIPWKEQDWLTSQTQSSLQPCPSWPCPAGAFSGSGQKERSCLDRVKSVCFHCMARKSGKGWAPLCSLKFLPGPSSGGPQSPLSAKACRPFHVTWLEMKTLRFPF